MGPIYGPEDMICGWVSRKQKAISSLQRPVKRPVTGTSSKLDFSNIDNKDNLNLEAKDNNIGCAAPMPTSLIVLPSPSNPTSLASSLISTTLVNNVSTNTIAEHVVSSIKRDKGNILARGLTLIPIVLSS